MAPAIVPAFFSGASERRLSAEGSSRLIDSRSANSPACSISQGLASGIV
jgi:hypothetical protein